MARYDYAHEISTTDPMVAAAFRVAQKAHEGQLRGKLDADGRTDTVKEIAHPVMGFRILTMMGENDPLTLAGILLHDALEKGSQFEHDAAALHAAMVRELRLEHYPEDQIERDVSDLIYLVHEVTNPPGKKAMMPKEMYQVDRARHMSVTAKKVKLVDQAMSLLCNLTMENDPNVFSSEKAKEFARKATSLVSAIMASAAEMDAVTGSEVQAVKQLEPYHHLFGRVLKLTKRLLEQKDMAGRETIRDLVDFERVVMSKTAMPVIPLKHRIADRIELDGSPNHEDAGAAMVEINQYGRIASVTMHENPEGGKDHPSQKIQMALIDALRRRSHLMYEELQLGEGTQVMLTEGARIIDGRRYSFEASPNVFIAAAREAGAITDRDARHIEAYAREAQGFQLREGSKRRYLPPEWGGPHRGNRHQRKKLSEERAEIKGRGE